MMNQSLFSTLLFMQWNVKRSVSRVSRREQFMVWHTIELKLKQDHAIRFVTKCTNQDDRKLE